MRKHETAVCGTARTVVWEVGKCENRRKMPFMISIYLLPDSLSSSLHFSQKPWKLRGKVVSLHKKSCTRQIESKLSLRSFAFSLPPNSLKKFFVYVKLGLKIMNLCESVGVFLCPGLAASAFTFPQSAV